MFIGCSAKHLKPAQSGSIVAHHQKSCISLRCALEISAVQNSVWSVSCECYYDKNVAIAVGSRGRGRRSSSSSGSSSSSST